MFCKEDGVEVEVEDGGGGRVEDVVVVMVGGVVVVLVIVVGVIVVVGGVVVVKMITCLVVWQPSQECWWAALGAGEGVKSIVSGVGMSEGDWCLSVSIWVGEVVVGGFFEVFRFSLVTLLSKSGLMTMANVVKEEKMDKKRSWSIFLLWLRAA